MASSSFRRSSSSILPRMNFRLVVIISLLLLGLFLVNMWSSGRFSMFNTHEGLAPGAAGATRAGATRAGATRAGATRAGGAGATTGAASGRAATVVKT